MDVVLVGLPGSGKSVVGRRLAKTMPRPSSTSTAVGRADTSNTTSSPMTARRPSAPSSSRASPNLGHRSEPQNITHRRDQRRTTSTSATLAPCTSPAPSGSTAVPASSPSVSPAPRTFITSFTVRQTIGASPANSRSGQAFLRPRAGHFHKFRVRQVPWRRWPAGPDQGPLRRGRRRDQQAGPSSCAPTRRSGASSWAQDRRRSARRQLDRVRARQPFLVSEPGAWASVGERLAYRARSHAAARSPGLSPRARMPAPRA